MRYVTREGEALKAATASELIDELRRFSRSPGQTRAAFITIFARNVALQTGHAIRTSPDETVLADLMEAGLIESLN